MIVTHENMVVVEVLLEPDDLMTLTKNFDIKKEITIKNLPVDYMENEVKFVFKIKLEDASSV